MSASHTDHVREGAIASFYIGEDLFGLDANGVQEVLRDPAVTHVPHAPTEVDGLLNLRGQVVTVISLRDRLGLTEVDDSNPEELTTGSDETQTICVVLKTPDGPVCVLVDRVGDVLGAPSEELEPPPDTLPAEVRDHILGVHKMDDRLLLILDIDRVVATPTLQET